MTSAIRAFRGCRELFAPAKSAASLKTSSSTSKRTTTAATSKSPPKASRSSAPAADKAAQATVARNTGGILKPTPVSPALHSFLGVPETSRSDAVKKVWEYIKFHNLQNPENKKEIFCDDKLKTIFEGKDKVGFLEIGKLLSNHFVKSS